MSIKRYWGQPLPIVVTFKGNPFTVYGKDYSDVSEVCMNFKRDLENDADDVYLEQTLSGGGVTIDEPNNKFIMKMDGGYTNLVKGTEYSVVIACTVSGITEKIELKMNDNCRKVLITPDENRS